MLDDCGELRRLESIHKLSKATRDNYTKLFLRVEERKRQNQIDRVNAQV